MFGFLVARMIWIRFFAIFLFFPGLTNIYGQRSIQAHQLSAPITIDGIHAQDFSIVRSMVFLGSVLYILGLLLTDISYTLVDPRVRLVTVTLYFGPPWAGAGRASATSIVTRPTMKAGVIFERRPSARVCR